MTQTPMNPLGAIRHGLVRTYGDFLKLSLFSYGGTCCACHEFGKQVWQISTRASICKECCERKSTEVLGSIARAERKARSYAKAIVLRREYAGCGSADEVNTKFYASLAHVSPEFMQKALDEAHAAANS